MLHRALILLIAAAGTAADESKAAFKVIVNPQNDVRELDRRQLSDLFLKKATRWPNSDLARPIDLAGSSPARDQFSSAVIGRSVEAVRQYWQQLIFSGRGIPPPEADSDSAVVSYVLKHKGAVGYVSASADVGAAKVVAVR